MLISTIFAKLNKGKAPFKVAVFLCAALILGNAWVLNAEDVEKGVLGGPITQNQSVEDAAPMLHEGFETGAVTAAATPDEASFSGGFSLEEGPFVASLEDRGRPMGIFASRGGLITYAVKSGDTLSGIASEFGVSIQTITGANPKIRANALQIGQELTILPVSGAVYQVKGGEDIESIAALFNVSPERIKEYNNSVNFGALEQGTPLIIPGAKSGAASSGSAVRLPDLGNYFIQPTQGFNWGRIHNYNAVDIANACGTPVSAAAEGLVVDSVSDGWNGGYGHAILIEHPNETKTRYAHLDQVLAGIGDYIKQGQQIGTMGNTGNVHGPTGCHLHFEVEDAQNPFAK